MAVTAEIRDGRILAVIPWDGGRGRDLAKSIPGRKALWDKSVEPNRFIGWSYPLAWSTCVELRKKFGAKLEIGPKLTEWAWEERRRTEHLESVRDGDNADLPRLREVAPGLWQALQARPFQIAGAAFIAQGKRVILGDEPRLGKTYQALAAIVESGARTILVACPRTATRSVWEAKIRELLGDQAHVAQEGRDNRIQVLQQFSDDTRSERRWLIVNKEMIRVARRYRCMVNADGRPTKFVLQGQPLNRVKPGRKGGCTGAHEHRVVHIPRYPQLFETTYDAVILDECHHALASTKNVQSDNISQIRMGAVKLPISDTGIRLGLSGTPFRSKLQNSWGVLNWARPDVFTSFWQFAERHFKVVSDGYGQVVDDSKVKDKQAFDAELRPYYLARTKAEVAPQLPPIEYVNVLLEMEGNQAKAYRDMEDNATADLANGKILANGVLAELTRLKQFACSWGQLSSGTFYPIEESNKLEWVRQFLDERKELTGKIVIATQFTKLANMFTEAIRNKGWQVLSLTGESSDAQRAHAQHEFQNGRTRVIVINMFAGGEAIDLSAADEMIFLDDPWTDDTRQQAENRIQSLAKKQKLTIYRLRSADTVEEWIADLNDEQRQLLMSAKPKSLKLMQEAISTAE